MFNLTNKLQTIAPIWKLGEFYYKIMMFLSACPAGHFGQNCSVPCLDGKYGQQCKLTCNCTRDLCDSKTGCKCKAGYTGALCDKGKTGF